MLADRLFASVWSTESWSASEINTHACTTRLHFSLKLVRQGLGSADLNGPKWSHVHVCSLVPRLTYRVVIWVWT